LGILAPDPVRLIGDLKGLNIKCNKGEEEGYPKRAFFVIDTFLLHEVSIGEEDNVVYFPDVFVSEPMDGIFHFCISEPDFD
jgi:hypothetical protein